LARAVCSSNNSGFRCFFASMTFSSRIDAANHKCF
jgi:hypothetical protein